MASASLVEDLNGRWVSESQANRVVEQARRFGMFAKRAFNVCDLDAVTPSMVAAFVSAPALSGSAPDASQQRSRRSAIRALYRVGRSAGLTAIDPAVDLRLPPLTSQRARRLTDDVIVECRASSLWSLGATRRSTTLALAEATCRSGEIPRVLREDIDAETGLITMRGGGRCAHESDS